MSSELPWVQPVPPAHLHPRTNSPSTPYKICKRTNTNIRTWKCRNLQDSQEIAYLLPIAKSLPDPSAREMPQPHAPMFLLAALLFSAQSNYFSLVQFRVGGNKHYSKWFFRELQRDENQCKKMHSPKSNYKLCWCSLIKPYHQSSYCNPRTV